MYKQYLSKDEKLAPWLDKIELPVISESKDLYADLLQSIVHQQLSTKAAATIHGRFLNIFENRYPDAGVLLGLPNEDLRAVGLSNQKVQYVKNIAQKYKHENWSHEELIRADDETLIKELTQIKGVGTWSVQMLLIFSLNRPDVFPVDDLGIQNGMKMIYELSEDKKLLKKEMQIIAENWKPYRSYATRVIWRVKDGGN